MIRRQLLAAGIAAASLALASAPATAAQTIKLTAAAGHPPVFLWVKLLDEFFIPEVDRRLAGAGGKYQIAWTKAWGGTLVKLGAEGKGIADGVADLGMVSTIFEAAKFPLQNITYFTPFGSDSIQTVTDTVAQAQRQVKAMGDAWTKNGLVFLGGTALDTYHVWSTFPLRSIDDLRGRKILAPGPSANWLKNTGAVAVAGSLPTYYKDIQSGVADGVLTFTTGAWAAKVHEVAPYITRVNFGSQYAGGIAISKRRFDKLPAEVKKVLTDVGAEYAVRFAKAQDAAAAALLQKMVQAGAKVSTLSDAERKRWADALPPVAKTWAADGQSRGLPAGDVLRAYMDALKKTGTSLPRDWAN